MSLPSVSSSTTTSDPQTHLLLRWKRISEQISHARLSRDAVIALNRSLDLAEETILHRAAIAENSKRVETDKGSEIPGPIFSDEFVLDRVKKAVSLLLLRQQNLKVSIFTLYRIERLSRRRADYFLSAPP